MEFNSIKWHLDDLVKKYEDEIAQLKKSKDRSDRHFKDSVQALRICRSMFDMALPHVIGLPIEEDFRLYMNIISGVIGDVAWKQDDIMTPEEHGKWIDEQLSKRDY